MAGAEFRARGTWCCVCLLVVAIVMGWGGCFSPCVAAEQGQQAGASPEYLVGIGDVLEVSVWNEPEISKTVFVRLDGKISLPLIGDVPAQGASPQLLAQRISTEISKFFTDPNGMTPLLVGKAQRV